MKKLFISLSIFLALLLMLMSFLSVMMIHLNNKSEAETDTEYSEPSTEPEAVGFTVLANDSTKWFDTHTVNLYITSSRDCTFFIGYTDAYGTSTASWTDVEAGKNYLNVYEVVDSISFSIDGDYYVVVDGVKMVGADELDILHATDIELVLY